MIYAYALCYYCLEYTERFIDSLVDNATEPIHLTIVENKSERSAEIEASMCHRVELGRVQTYIQFEENLMLQALRYGYRLNPPGHDSDEFVMLTDSDVLFIGEIDCIGEIDWVRMMKHAFSFHDVGVMGWCSSLSNFYDTPNRDFGELRAWFDEERGFSMDTNFGGYFVCIRKRTLDGFMETDLAVADAVMLGYAQSLGLRTGRFETEIYHQGWDSWRDYPEYFKEKVERHWDLSATFPPMSEYKIVRA